MNVPRVPLLSLALCTALTAAVHARDPAPSSVHATGAGTGASPAHGLDMAAAVQRAVDWHPTVRNAVSYLYEAGDGIAAARAGYRPQLRAGLGSEFRNRDISGYDSRRVHRFTVSASQMLYDFGKVSSAVDRAEAGREAAQARVLLAVDQLAQDTAHAWIEVRRHEALLDIAHAQQRGVTAIADLARERRAKGATPLSDELQAQVREEAAQANTLAVEAQLERWRAQLRQLVGVPALPATVDAVPPALQASCEIMPGTVAVPSQVLLAQAELREAQAMLDNARAQSRPTISLEGSVGRGLDADSRMGESHDSTLMLNVSAPLYEGGGNRARSRAAGHALSASEAALDHARLRAGQALLDAQTQAVGHAGRSRVLDGRTRSIEQTRDLYRQQYLDLGTRSLLDLLNAEQEFHQARQENLNNRHDLQRMQVDCLSADGRLREAFGLEGRTVAGVELAP